MVLSTASPREGTLKPNTNSSRGQAGELMVPHMWKDTFRHSFSPSAAAFSSDFPAAFKHCVDRGAGTAPLSNNQTHHCFEREDIVFNSGRACVTSRESVTFASDLRNCISPWHNSFDMWWLFPRMRGSGGRFDESFPASPSPPFF